jgi:uncharacterized protein
MRRGALAALSLLLLAAGAAALDVPFLSGRVNDEARLLDAGSASALESSLKDYETRTGRQIAVLTIPSLAGEDLEGYSLKVARTWKLGRKGKDDGVLILVARDDHKIRIEVGYGLEGALPDALAGRIIREGMVPRFRAGAFAAGIQEGAEAVIAALDGRAPAPRPTPFGRIGLLTAADFLFMAMGLILILVDVNEIFMTGTDLSIYLCVGVVLALFFSPLTKIWGPDALIVTLLAHYLGFPIGKLVMNYTTWGSRYQIERAGPHHEDAIFCGGFGGSSGGGFSGGGGSFGGGGASGGW